MSESVLPEYINAALKDVVPTDPFAFTDSKPFLILLIASDVVVAFVVVAFWIVRFWIVEEPVA